METLRECYRRRFREAAASQETRRRTEADLDLIWEASSIYFPNTPPSVLPDVDVLAPGPEPKQDEGW